MSATREAPLLKDKCRWFARARPSELGLGKFPTVLQMVLELHQSFPQFVPVFGRDDPFAVEALEDVVLDAHQDLRRE